jgi:error-prone DNA polymerase
MADYVELQVTSNYSFLRGASHPHELVRAAARLRHPAIAIADRNSLAGVVRAHVAAREAKLRLVVGARIDLDAPPQASDAEPSFSLLCFPTDRAAYGRLSRLLTEGRRRAPKGECHLGWHDLEALGEGQRLVVLPSAAPPNTRFPGAKFIERLRALARRRPPRSLHLALTPRHDGMDERRRARLRALASDTGVPLVATNDALYHAPERRPLMDVLTCIRLGTTIDAAGLRLAAHAERHLKLAEEMLRLTGGDPAPLAASVEIAEACRFSLDELRQEYPAEAGASGRTPQEELAHRAGQSAAERFPQGIPEEIRTQLEKELALIDRLGYAAYFLTVHDLVRFARRKKILCQGRGSAANSTLCYCLGITSVDPQGRGFLFERFVSAARNEPPDIDVDFEHERREEVIQHIYEKYGRDRAGLTAVVISYRTRGALRDVGKVMGLTADMIDQLASTTWGWGRDAIDPELIRKVGIAPDDPRIHLTLALVRALIGFPRHLSQHVGGFVMTRGPLADIVPIENAAMEDRTVIQWDKNDLDALGMLKVDVLALGMLTCLRKGFELLRRHCGLDLTLGSVPAEDPRVYEMLQRADAIGVFQVESRAQMSMLPRLKPARFYDLVIEVAIVRPGPIQGDMVHPYLRRREGKEPEHYPSEALRGVLEKTKGVPLFQEQAMQIAIVAAGFSPEEADRLRRAMATFRNDGDMEKFRTRFVEGMVANAYERDFAERCFRQIEGFSTYGFPESHAASFALLVYDSAWLKCHHPAVFACALLNSQPMGFYAPAQIVRDASDHGVEIRPVDVNHSDWDCTLERGKTGALVLRLGFRQAKGVAEIDAGRLVEMRGAGYRDPDDLRRRTGLIPAALEALARADAFGSMGLDRRAALWAIKGTREQSLPLFAPLAHDGIAEPAITLPVASMGESVVDDYNALRLTLRDHPLKLLRARLPRGILRAAELATIEDGAPAHVAGLVLVRQMPGGGGIVFVTLEDETGIANLVVMPKIYERNRPVIIGARLLACSGRLQKQGIVIHVRGTRFTDLTPLLGELIADRRAALEPPLSRADEIKHPPPAMHLRSRDFH